MRKLRSFLLLTTFFVATGKGGSFFLSLSLSLPPFAQFRRTQAGEELFARAKKKKKEISVVVCLRGLFLHQTPTRLGEKNRFI